LYCLQAFTHLGKGSSLHPSHFVRSTSTAYFPFLASRLFPKIRELQITPEKAKNPLRYIFIEYLLRQTADYLIFQVLAKLKELQLKVLVINGEINLSVLLLPQFGHLSF
jgi:hypothetical protein